MSIQSMRHITKTKRWIMVSIIVILIAGLLISYAVWSSPDHLNSGNTDTTQAKIDAYTQSISSQETELANNPEDFSTLSTLGELYYNLGEAQASSTDLNVKTGSKTSFNKSAGYYNDALNNAPENLNDKGKANLLMKVGVSYLAGGDTDNGNKYLRQGLEAAPTDYDNNVLFAQLMFYQGRIAEAQAALEYYKSLLPAGDSNIANIDSLLQQIEDEWKKQSESENQDDSTDTDKSDTGTDDGTTSKTN